MLPEEKELRKLSPLFATKEGRKEYRDAISVLVRAVREDDAKVILEQKELVATDWVRAHLAAAIRSKK